ncbi:Glucose starvation-inducible protein B [compost metagenome]
MSSLSSLFDALAAMGFRVTPVPAPLGNHDPMPAYDVHTDDGTLLIRCADDAHLVRFLAEMRARLQPARADVDTEAPTPPPASAPKRRGPAKGDPRCVAAGKRGGAKLLAERGPDYYQSIGRKGGAVTRDRFGYEFYAAIGQQGGERLVEERGAGFLRDIAKRSNGRRRPTDSPETP